MRSNKRTVKGMVVNKHPRVPSLESVSFGEGRPTILGDIPMRNDDPVDPDVECDCMDMSCCGECPQCANCGHLRRKLERYGH